MKQKLGGLLLMLLFIVTIVIAAALPTGPAHTSYIPLIHNSPPPPEPLVEFRGLWVSRFDWTEFGQPANPAKLDEIVQNMAAANFNAIFFQVRGSADAYYQPGPEPWAPRVSGGSLGQAPQPLWDPLAYLIAAAHQHNIQVHAYLNAYPVWDQCATTPPMVSPTPLYHQLNQQHGEDQAFQWGTNQQVYCSGYVLASPAAPRTNQQLLEVAAHLVQTYALDGLHLDNIRYGGSSTSCDPVSAAAYGAPCFSDGHYADWQRQQVNQTVATLYQEIILPNPHLWYSAAVWPVHTDQWGWGSSQGYHDYYQDSKAWLAGDYIDSISPMIYPGTFNCPDNSFWNLSRWQTLVADFQANSHGGYIIPGIGTGYCEFAEIESRIAAARQAGTIGHALFSYRSLLTLGYFDDLANGPYAQPATIPTPR